MPKISVALWLTAAPALLPAGSAFADAESDYNRTCAACHNLGVAGAPRIGDSSAWEERIARGDEALYENAINGYTGAHGVMPPKGGFTDLSDEQVKAIVAYMVSRANGG